MRDDLAIGPEDRKVIAFGLAKLLAATFALALKTRGFSWNVEGPRSHALRSLFQAQHRALWRALDPIAARLRALGHYAPMAASELAQIVEIEEEHGVPGADAMIAQLIDGHGRAARTIRCIAPAIEDIGDLATRDLLGRRTRAHEDALCTLKALAKPEADPGIRSVLETLRLPTYEGK